MSAAVSIRGDFAALRAFIDKAGDLSDLSPDFEDAIAGIDLNAAVIEADDVASTPGAMVVVVRPAPEWIALFRRFGGVWP